MYGVSVVYTSKSSTSKNRGKTFMTFFFIPGDEFDDYFCQQICVKHNWEYVSAQPEPNINRHRTPDEIVRGIIRKPTEFMEKGDDYNIWEEYERTAKTEESK